MNHFHTLTGHSLRAKDVGDEQVQVYVDKIFVFDEQDENLVPDLVKLDDLEELFQKFPYNFQSMQEKIERIFLKINGLFHKTSTLWEAEYNLPAQPLQVPTHKAARKKKPPAAKPSPKKKATPGTPSKRPRNHLQTTPESKRKRLLGKKKSAHRIEFGDDESEDGHNIELAEPPEKRVTLPNNKLTLQKNAYTGVGPDDGRFDQFGRVTKRVPFTKEEVNAIIAGYNNFKHEHFVWLRIKQEYQNLFKNRSTVQIKDKFRNMKRKGEI